MKIRIWRGYHDRSLTDLLDDVLARGDLLVLCPPGMRDFSFLDQLPPADISAAGTWTREEATIFDRPRSSSPDFTIAPVLGLFTSGTSSGTRRLVLYSRQNVEASLAAILSFFNTARIDSVFCYPQPFHTFGLVLGYLLARHLSVPLSFAAGAYSRASHEAWLTKPAPGRLTLGTPTHFLDLMGYVRASAATPPATYSCIIGGAPVPTALWHEIRNVLRIEAPSVGYGCTEASPGLTHLGPGIPPARDADIGVVVPGISLHVHPGSIEFSGDAVCLAMVENGVLRFPSTVEIPDLLEPIEGGRFVFRGRAGLTINRGGTKISIEEVELSTYAVLGLEIACIRLEDPRLGEDVGILAIAAEVDDAAATKLREHLHVTFHIRLAPGSLRVVTDLPRNASGKRDRERAAALFRENPAIDGGA